MAKKQTVKNAKQSQIDKKVDSVMELVYGSNAIKHAPKKDMIMAEVPKGSLIVSPHTMSKREFNIFRDKWIMLMERTILKKSKSVKKASNESSNGKNWDNHVLTQKLINKAPKATKRAEIGVKQSIAGKFRNGGGVGIRKKPIATPSMRMKAGASQARATTSRNMN